MIFKKYGSFGRIARRKPFVVGGKTNGKTSEKYVQAMFGQIRLKCTSLAIMHSAMCGKTQTKHISTNISYQLSGTILSYCHRISVPYSY